MKNTFKLPALAVVALTVAYAVSAAGIAGGGTQSGVGSDAGVTSYVSMTYNSQTCGPDGRTRYQIWMSDWRWYREYLDRGVNASVSHGEKGTSCEGPEILGYGYGPFQVCWADCTGGDPHWSEEIISFAPQDWSYIGEPEFYFSVWVGARAESTVFNRNTGNTIGGMCVDAAILGSTC